MSRHAWPEIGLSAIARIKSAGRGGALTMSSRVSIVHKVCRRSQIYKTRARKYITYGLDIGLYSYRIRRFIKINDLDDIS